MDKEELGIEENDVLFTAFDMVDGERPSIERAFEQFYTDAAACGSHLVASISDEDNGADRRKELELKIVQDYEEEEGLNTAPASSYQVNHGSRCEEFSDRKDFSAISCLSPELSSACKALV